MHVPPTSLHPFRPTHQLYCCVHAKDDQVHGCGHRHDAELPQDDADEANLKHVRRHQQQEDAQEVQHLQEQLDPGMREQFQPQNGAV